MNWMRQKLQPHIGHHIVCVAYGAINDPHDVCIECEDCMCVLVSAGDFGKSSSVDKEGQK